MRAYGFAGSRVLALQMHPFKLELYEGGKLVAVANGDNKFYFEHHRSRDDKAPPSPLTLTLILTLTLAGWVQWITFILAAVTTKTVLIITPTRTFQIP